MAGVGVTVARARSFTPALFLLVQSSPLSMTFFALFLLVSLRGRHARLWIPPSNSFHLRCLCCSPFDFFYSSLRYSRIAPRILYSLCWSNPLFTLSCSLNYWYHLSLFVLSELLYWLLSSHLFLFWYPLQTSSSHLLFWSSYLLFCCPALASSTSGILFLLLLASTSFPWCPLCSCFLHFYCTLLLVFCSSFQYF